MAHVLGGGTDKALVKANADVAAYKARCEERPAWKKTIDAYCERVQAG